MRHRNDVRAWHSLLAACAIGLVICLLAGGSDEMMAQPAPDTLESQSITGTDTKQYVFREQDVFRYSNRGKRDPFKPLVSEGSGPVETDLLNIEEATLTGIIWMGDHMVALFKDKKGKSYYMKKGDPVYNGRIVDISDNSVVVTVFEFGGSRQVELRVTEHVSNGSGG
jgi:Tfp pilus assembly protein PilP